MNILKERLKTATKERELCTKKNEDLKTKKKLLEGDLKTVIGDSDGFKVTAEKMNDECDEFHEKLEKIGNDLEELDTEGEFQITEIKNLKEKAMELSLGRVKIQLETQKITKERNDLNTKAQEIASEIDSLQAESTEIERQKKIFAFDKERLVKQNEGMKKKLEMFKKNGKNTINIPPPGRGIPPMGESLNSSDFSDFS